MQIHKCVDLNWLCPKQKYWTFLHAKQKLQPKFFFLSKKKIEKHNIFIHPQHMFWYPKKDSWVFRPPNTQFSPLVLPWSSVLVLRPVKTKLSIWALIPDPVTFIGCMFLVKNSFSSSEDDLNLGQHRKLRQIFIQFQDLIRTLAGKSVVNLCRRDFRVSEIKFQNDYEKTIAGIPRCVPMKCWTRSEEVQAVVAFEVSYVQGKFCPLRDIAL